MHNLRKRFRATAALLAVLSLAGASAARAQERTIQGEVVDPAMYLREGRHGKDVEELIFDAVDGGQALALLEDGTGALYLFLASEPGADPNELVYEYAGRSIKATGPVYAQGGVKGMVVTRVESLDGPAVAMPADVEP